MKHLVPLTILTVLPCLVTHAAPATEADADAQAVTSKITAVTVYADRARVTRTATVNLPAGTARLAFQKLPGWIDEGSVRISVAPANVAELLDVQVLKTYLARPDDDELRKAEAAVQEIADQLAALDDERAALDSQSKQIDSIRAFSLEKLPKDAATREIKVEEYGGVVKFVGNSLLEIAKSKRELDKKRRDLQPEMTARQKKLNDLRQRAQLEQRTVLITVKASAAKPATVTLTYMLPGATWEPVHELRAGDGADKVALASFGIVTQTSGEDWDGVALSLSTQRSTETIKIPELEKMLVGSGRPLPKLTTGEGDTFGIATGKFAGQVGIWNAAFNTDAQQMEFTDNWKRQQAVQVRVVKQFEELQEQRGTTAHFAALAAQTVRTDGRQVRVPIGSVQLAAQPRIVAAPEVSLNAARTADLVNTGKQPLLPGRVLLYVEGAFLGTTAVDFVAPGESFPMFLGVADQIKLSRTLDKKNSSLTWTGRRTRLQVSYLVTVENLGDKPETLQLADRVPVSETDEVRVLNVKLTPAVKPDNKGLVKWDVKLAAKETKTFRLEYMLDYPTGVAEEPVPDQAIPSPAAMPSDSSRRLKQQIMQLERALQ